MLGDSIAAGLGAERAKHTLGGRLARGIARSAGRSVRLRTAAVVGSESSMLADQLAALPDSYRPDVAVIVVGGNDVTHRVPVAESVDHLGVAVDALRARGAEVVVGTCPDLGALRPMPQPLRALGSRASRQLAQAQRETALARGARVVSLSHVVGPFFITNPDEMFSLDRFHPSAQGYKRTAKAMLPSVLAALGWWRSCRSGTTRPGWAAQARVPGCAPLLVEPARRSRRLPRRRLRRRPGRPVATRRPGSRLRRRTMPRPSGGVACSRAT